MIDHPALSEDNGTPPEPTAEADRCGLNLREAQG